MFLGFILIGCKPKKQLPIVQSLHSNWLFHHPEKQQWYPATVPGNIFSDLLQNKLIEDPFIGINEEKVQWVSKTDWTYRSNFAVDKNILYKKNIVLNFKGLDTYANIYLNDSLILKTNNAFRSYSVDVKSILQKENQLQIEFSNTQGRELKAKEKLPYELPEGNRVFTRKAQFQYGWDWGPKLNTSGIWKNIYLKSWNDIVLSDVYISTNKLTKEKAILQSEVTINSEYEGSLKIITEVGKQQYSNVIDLEKGIHKYTIPLVVENPKLWWPHNIGEPYLYNIKIQLIKDRNVIDQKIMRYGLRTIELVTEKDSVGQSFYFKVNGTPVYAKGANYIPQNSFQSNVKKTHYEKLLSNAVDANMNMLRVWGGGIYENDVFYQLCDEKGILVWQDFMFACAMYPGNNNFLNNVQQETIEQVTRLRNHPCIALWCGNNENSEGWHRWGWQTGKTDVQKKEIWGNYLKVFDSILPHTVNRLSRQTPYWESSPKYGRGNSKYKTEGDAHDWWVWHDGFPFEHFQENVPRFMSEFGFQSFPSFETINFINQQDSVNINTEAIKSHQKHSRGFKLIKEYMQRDYPVPTSDEDYAYVSQLVQARGITMGIEAQRSAKPYNMGSLYWQLNDCWPAISWSSIDYFGNWKALHYKAKKAFNNILLSSKIEDNHIIVQLISDLPFLFKNDLFLKITDFNGNKFWSQKKTVNIQKNSNQIVGKISLDSLRVNLKKIVLVASIDTIENSYHYFVKPKELELKSHNINTKIEKVKGGFLIKLTTNSLQKDVFLHTKNKGHFSDNFFDMLPNHTKTIFFETKEKSLNNLKIKTLNSILQN